ncbi:GntR family transcriptional regulator [Mycobacterium paraseoulense]|uniref:GntR family transcriptional regulator n=1 Tax=Mycobacterium paraseoulense TaxID=590652 RepID=A0A1X0IFQ1_9MYCO|nr:GntR family transcriptional regulator [Mycobacterium paraseoulense]MCV7393903.1 GntR family transcriptional regulator [Mycobacterium paraseoulense]ORB45377.1 GntR family transcriptional regulator [Mycobacterium paraseoulense]BBZ70470.1 GntR family transcriptional regulator [Mycobacterium paraseoulense]
MTLSRSDSGPAYRQVARDLRAQITSGRYSNGEQLPTESELSQSYGLSRQTVRHAFSELVAEGLVYRVPGRGTFAAEGRAGRYLRQLGSIEDLMCLSLDTTMRVVSPLQRCIDIEAAGRLRLESDAQYTIVFIRLHDDVPFVVTTVHLTPPCAQLLADAPELKADAVSTATVIGLLDPRLDRPITQAAQSITVALASDQVAAELRCPLSHPVLRVDRLYSNDLGEPVELSISYFLPEHYTYRVTLRRDSVSLAGSHTPRQLHHDGA